MSYLHRDGLHVACACRMTCGDAPEGEDHPYAVCKGLPIPRPPLVKLVVVREERPFRG